MKEELGGKSWKLMPAFTLSRCRCTNFSGTCFCSPCPPSAYTPQNSVKLLQLYLFCLLIYTYTAGIIPSMASHRLLRIGSEISKSPPWSLTTVPEHPKSVSEESTPQMYSPSGLGSKAPYNHIHKNCSISAACPCKVHHMLVCHRIVAMHQPTIRPLASPY